METTTNNSTKVNALLFRESLTVSVVSTRTTAGEKK